MLTRSRSWASVVRMGQADRFSPDVACTLEEQLHCFNHTEARVVYADSAEGFSLADGELRRGPSERGEQGAAANGKHQHTTPAAPPAVEVAPAAAAATGSLLEESSSAATPMVEAAASSQKQECCSVTAPKEAPSIKVAGGAPPEALNNKAKTILYAAVSEDMVRGSPLLRGGELHSPLLLPMPILNPTPSSCIISTISILSHA